ncbi:ATP-binding protein [Candidatus Bathyarchaeota archaeon]|nr:ATP-binding protein [Candidatus Bathyarchaeota archaeon]
MKRYLVDKKEDIKKLKVLPRSISFRLTKNFIRSIVGPRRAGKTYSLYDLILNKEKIRDEDYLFINFEDEAINQLRREEIVKAISYHHEVYGKEPEFIFLDEVQSLKNWERFVYSIFEKKRYFIFVTGSSSRLLSKEIATQLRGRSLSTLILPFSFKEFLSYKKVEVKKIIPTTKENEVKNLLRIYLRDGGFPDLFFTNVERKNFFRDYIDLVIFRDIIERFKIKGSYLIKLMIANMLSSFSSEFSINKLFNTLKSQGIKISKKTLYSYASALEDVMFCFFLRKFSISPRKIMLSIPKIYFNDTGLITNTLISFEDNIGKLMENLVFLELKRREEMGEMSTPYYWRDYQGSEADFFISKPINQLIQVTYASNKDEIEKREFKSLIKASKELKCNNLLIITWDYEDEFKTQNKKIKCTPLWKWLLSIQ